MTQTVVKMERKKKREMKVRAFVIVVCLLISLFLPTSLSGVMFGTYYVLAVYIVEFLLFCILLKGRRNRTRFIFCLFTFFYLVLITLLSFFIVPDVRFSLVRGLPIINLLLLLSIDFKNDLSYKATRTILNIVVLIMTIVGVAVILRVGPVMNILKSLYTDSYESATINAMDNAKPVFTYAIYTRTAFVYTLLFLCYYKDLMRGHKISLIPCLILMALTFFLKSNSGLVYFGAMALLILFYFRKKPWIIVLTIIVVVIYIKRNIDALLLELEKITSITTSGFGSRYTSGLFAENMKIINSSLGIGFNILDTLTYADSGWLFYLTMGSFPLMIVIYVLLFFFLKKNVKSWFFIIVFMAIMSFEFVENGLNLYRLVLLYPFVMQCFAYKIVWVPKKKTRTVVIRKLEPLKEAN